MSATDHLSDLQFQHSSWGNDRPRHAVTAVVRGQSVGRLEWLSKHYPGQAEDGEHPGQVTDLVVNPEHRRKGIATAMWAHAHSALPHDPPQHSERQTNSGRAWARRVG